MLCALIFIHEWRDLQFSIDSERQIFEKLFHSRLSYLQSFCQKSAERKSQKKYFFTFRFDVFFMTGLVTLRVFGRNLLRGNRRRNIFFHISFWCLSLDTKPGFTSNTRKPTHYVLDNGDFTMERWIGWPRYPGLYEEATNHRRPQCRHNLCYRLYIPPDLNVRVMDNWRFRRSSTLRSHV